MTRRTLRPGRWSHRGQAGLTVVELLVVAVASALLMVPLVGFFTLTLGQRDPITRSNSDDSQFQLLRIQLIRDWSRATIVKTNLSYITSGDPNECKNGETGAFYSVNPPFNVQGPRIAIQTKEVGNRLPKRIVYNLVQSTERPGTWDVVRRECSRNFNPVLDGVIFNDAGGWRTEPGSVVWDTTVESEAHDNGSVTVVARGISTLTSSTTCNTGAPAVDPATGQTRYAPCDPVVTMTGVGGKRQTVRLYQQIGDLVGRRS
jgi:hypothetical protein